MQKLKIFLKNLRPEFRVALFFFIIVIFYSLYSFIAVKFDKGMSIIPSQSTQSKGENKTKKSSSIAEAINAPRPVIISPQERQETFKSMTQDYPDVKNVEVTAEVENPAVWIYMSNDGSRKDNLASEYCRWLHNKGIIASSVTILDVAARAKGKIVETGESKCM